MRSFCPQDCVFSALQSADFLRLCLSPRAISRTIAFHRFWMNAWDRPLLFAIRISQVSHFFQSALRTFESVIQREWNCVSAIFRWLFWSGGRQNRFDNTSYLELPRLVLTGSLRWSKTLTIPSKVKWISIYFRLIFAHILLTCITSWICNWQHWSPFIDQQFLICVSVDKICIQAEWRYLKIAMDFQCVFFKELRPTAAFEMGSREWICRKWQNVEGEVCECLALLWYFLLPLEKWYSTRNPTEKEKQTRIKWSWVRIRPWPLRWVLGQGSLLSLSQGESFTLASISYLAILVKYILAKKKKNNSYKRSAEFETATTALRQDPLIWVFGHFWLFCTMV